MVDFGYDVSDYCDVDPIFGTLDDFDRLVEDAHSLGLRVIIDWVPNHTSDRHPWFVDAASGPGSDHRNWYVWRDARPDGSPPNNWVAAFDLSAPTWTLDEPSGQWYLHLFEAGPTRPQLGRARGGARPCTASSASGSTGASTASGPTSSTASARTPNCRTIPRRWPGIPHSALNDVPVTHGRLRELRRIVDSYRGDRLMVGEVYLLSTAAVATYYGEGDELHLAFNFPPLYARWQERGLAGVHRADRRRPSTRGMPGPPGCCPTTTTPATAPATTGRPRPGARTARPTERRSEARARAAAVLLLTLRGTPFLYQGEELGLLDAVIPADRQVDPGGRDGCRAPIPWDGGGGHGWPGRDEGPWLPFPPDAEQPQPPATCADDPSSILHLYRRLIELRHRVPALSLGAFELLDLPDGLLGYRRVDGADERVVVINFTDRSVVIDAEPSDRATRCTAPPGPER